jgi:hypothetical protein
MTDQEWSDCDDMKRMLAAIRGTVSDRKSRLFNVACCRRIWHLLTKPAVRAAILVGERFADGLADGLELRAALGTIHKERARTPTYTPQGSALQAAGFSCSCSTPPFPFQTAHDMRIALAATFPEAQRHAVHEREMLACCDLVREILGNPFRRMVVEPAWLTDSVRHLALAIYECHSFEDMPILADALEDAGCRQPALLDHCRLPPAPVREGSEPVGHVRGCWVLDLLLGKSGPEDVAAGPR